jgi:hypothetical protein
MTNEEREKVRRIVQRVATDEMSDLEGAPLTEPLIKKIQRRCRAAGLNVTEQQVRAVYFGDE